jgi:hypothetical protein
MLVEIIDVVSDTISNCTLHFVKTHTNIKSTKFFYSSCKRVHKRPASLSFFWKIRSHSGQCDTYNRIRGRRCLCAPTVLGSFEISPRCNSSRVLCGAMAFQARWRELKRVGWTSRRPTGLSNDLIYIKPGKPKTERVVRTTSLARTN